MAKKVKVESWQLLSDSPVGAKEGEDKFHLDSIAEVFGRAAVDTRQPITIGIYGKWGTGKTSLMRIIRQYIDAIYTENTVTVWFNAWQYEREEHLIIPLAATINKSLDEVNKKRWGSGFRKGATALSNALRSLAYGFSMKSSVGIPGLAGAEATLAGDKMIQGYKELSQDAIMYQSLYFDTFEQLNKVVSEKDVPRIVVFIDDLDRCTSGNAVGLLEHIKLILNQPGFAFFLGVNPVAIQSEINKKFKQSCDEYMDKIVQVPFEIPDREPDSLGSYIESLLGNFSLFEGEINNKDLKLYISEAGERNPRSIVRLLNRLVVKYLVDERDAEKNERIISWKPVEVLLDIALNASRYRNLVGVIDEKVFVTGDLGKRILTDIGSVLGQALSTDDITRESWIQTVKGANLAQKTDAWNKALQVIAEYEQLFFILNTEYGKRWLTDHEFRRSLGKVSVEIADKPPASMGKDTSLTPVKDVREVLRQITETDLPEVLKQIAENMRSIPGGSFQMGGENGHSNIQPQHEVTIKPFKMSAIPVTQVQWVAIMGNNPSRFVHPDHPVDSVSWKDCQRFIDGLKHFDPDKDYRLPTEAEWEYACRAGTTTKYHTGDGESALDGAGWYLGNSGGKTHPVREKLINNWGLYDMHGNVWEWCEDCYHDNYNGAPPDGNAWVNPLGNDRVLRGGAWITFAIPLCGSDYRNWNPPEHNTSAFGFRLVCR